MKTNPLFKLIPAMAMAASASLVQAGSIELEGYTLSWDSPNLVALKVGTTSRIPTASTPPYVNVNPAPDFSQDSVFTVVQFTWNNAVTASGQDSTALAPLPVFHVTAADGWALTEVGGYFNGTVEATGDAGLTAFSNSTLTLDLPPDNLYRSINPMYRATSARWGLSDTATRAVQCQDGICTGATQATLDMSQTYRFDFGPAGGNISFNYRPIYANDDYSFQFVKVQVERLAVPEPSTMLLMGLGLGSLMLVHRRRQGGAG
jgi:hypothetical protein